MAATRRGPRPKGPFTKQVFTLTTRITAETRARLDANAEVNGRSLSQEVELRLVRSIAEDDQLVAMTALTEQRRAAMLRTAELGLDSGSYDELSQIASAQLREMSVALENMQQVLAVAQQTYGTVVKLMHVVMQVTDAPARPSAQPEPEEG